MLGTVNKGNPFSYQMPDGEITDRSSQVVISIHQLNLDGLIGNDGNGQIAANGCQPSPGDDP